MNQILHILRYKLLTLINYNRKILSDKKNLIRSFLSSLIFIGFGFGAFLFSVNVLHFVLEEIKIGSFLLHRFSSILLFVFFLSISAGNIVVAYSMIFKSEEVFHLITKPIAFEKIFTLKMMESIFYSSPTFLLIGTSILAGYGFYYKVDWFFYPYAILFVFLPFVFSSAILGVLILILLIQIAGKIGTRWTISILVTSYILILFGFFRSVNPKNLVNEVMKYYPHLDFNLSFLDPSYIIFLPNHWFSESLYWFTKSEFSLAFKYSLLLNLLFVFLLIVSLLVGTKLYRKSFLVSLDLKSKKEIQKYYQRMFPSSERILDFRKSSIFDTQTEVLLKKEFHQFFRDPSQWIHLSVIVFLISIFIASIARVDLLNALPFLQTITYLSIFIFNSFLISSITLRFIYPVLSIEAQSFWKIKSSPIKPEKLILVKFLPIFLITLLIAESLNFFSHLSDSIPKILKTYSTINIFSISLTLAALNFWFGSYFISFTEKNPVKIASSQGATIAFLFNMIYLIFLVIILFYPVNEVFSKKAINVQVSQIGFLVSSVVLLIISLVVSFFAYRSGKKSLAEDY